MRELAIVSSRARAHCPLAFDGAVNNGRLVSRLAAKIATALQQDA